MGNLFQRILKRPMVVETEPAPQAAASPTVAPRPPRKRWERRPFDELLIELGSLPAPIDTRPRCFFIVGHPRSGTNWMSNLLNLHPHVCCRGELHLHDLLNTMPALVTEPHTAGFHEPMKTAMVRAFQEFIRATMSSMQQAQPDARWVGDHSPRQLRYLLPEAPTFIVVRDGRDVLCSLTTHFLNLQSRRAVLAGQPRDPIVRQTMRLFDRALAMCTADDDSVRAATTWLFHQEPWVRRWAASWQQHVLADVGTLRRIDRGEIPLKAMTVRYEDLHMDTAGILGRMLTLLGADPHMVKPIGTDPRTKPGYTEGRTSSHYRRGQVGDWRSQFTPDAARWFAEAGGEGLAALGYERGSDWVDRFAFGR